MTHALSNIIDLTNAPTPPRWFEFLFEPGRLQQHLQTEPCDPSPIQLIDLFFKNIPNLDPRINVTNSNNGTQNPTNTPSATPLTTNGSSPNPLASAPASEQPSGNGDNGAKICNGATNGDTNETTSNRNGNNGGPNNKSPGTELTDKFFNDLSDSHDIIIPPHSYEAKYRLRKTYALQTLAVKVASFLRWNLDTICNGLNIPTQYKLMQAFLAACSHQTCPLEVEKFAKVIYSHWFLKSAMTYRLSTLQPQSNSTTIIYLSQLQQQQQTADQMALMSMGELFLFDSKRLRDCVDELHAYIWDVAILQKNNEDSHSAKKLKTSTHPFKKAKLSRPKMECFDSRDEQYNDWKQSELIEPFDFMEAACYDLGRFLFFEENYVLSKDILHIIRDSSEKYPLLDKYLQSASEIMTTDDKRVGIQDDSESKSCDILSSEAHSRRKQTQDYLFNCMTEYNQNQGNKKDSEEVDMTTDIQDAAKKDVDLRFGAQQTHLVQTPSTSSWYLSMQIDNKEQYILEFGKGDDSMSRGNFKQALGYFVGALMLITDYFRVFSKAYVDEEPCITRMIQCSISLSCYTQAVVLCQMTKFLNYSIAFKQLNERICNDCCDDIYECIWNVTLLEYVINLHAKRGEVERRTKVIQLLGQLELNENNPEDVLREAEHVRRGRFFRIMSNKYL